MDPLIGSILLVPYNFVPEGWLPCDGRSIPVKHNEALYSLLGTRFGGDWNTSFNLPKLDAPDELRYIIAVQGAYPSRS